MSIFCTKSAYTKSIVMCISPTTEEAGQEPLSAAVAAGLPRHLSLRTESNHGRMYASSAKVISDFSSSTRVYLPEGAGTRQLPLQPAKSIPPSIASHPTITPNTTSPQLTSMAPPTHLDPSELGTKSYWDAAYTTERRNFAANTSDEGTVWFSDAGAEERMLSFLEDLSDEGRMHKGKAAQEDDGGENTQEGARFLDLGTGNGHLLFALREDGWEGDMVGVDYSPESVRLATSIRDAKDADAEFPCADISFHEWDILSQPPGAWLGPHGFDVVLDKGTFDAICLSQEEDAHGRRICEGYRQRVEPLVKKGGRFLITSCNWTDEELKGWFGGGQLELEGKVKYPSFTFGGQTGSSVVTLCYRRV
jgi:SAM-dependent methyltransferase